MIVRALKQITYDAAPGVEPRASDVLRTRTGRLWLVVSARRVRSRVAPNRWALEAVQIGEATETARILSFRWYPRGRKHIPARDFLGRRA